MTQSDPQPVATRPGGYVLAGGRSSRMGRDKALLQLAGHPLIHHAVAKLRRLCADVHILAGAEGSNPALAAHAPLIYDLHPNCGPISGVEAALAHSTRQWNLILPVDMPLLPAAFLNGWVQEVVGRPQARVALFMVDGRPHAMPLLIHRDAGPYLSRAIERGEYTLLAALEGAANQLGVAPDLSVLSASQQSAWFANLNTPEEFAHASLHPDSLDAL
jgi:molybdopterin-guanine dinucleotide biosynthesis protein A